MNLDFSKPISGYEFLSLCFSIVALFIPVLKFLYVKYLCPLKLEFYPNNKIKLYFNRSGAYVRIDGSYESKNKTTIFKVIKVLIKRNQDNSDLNLIWSSFVSPFSQRSNSGYIDVIETAHPITQYQDTMQPLFIEFADPYSTIENLHVAYSDKIQAFINDIDVTSMSYEEAKNNICRNDVFIEYKTKIFNELFWKSGRYDIKICVEYNDAKSKVFSYYFDIDGTISGKLESNIEELLLISLKNMYNIPYCFNNNCEVSLHAHR